MIGLAVVSMVLWAAAAFVTTAALSLVLTRTQRGLDLVSPRRRIGLLLALLAAPAAVGFAVVVLSFGPCLETAVRGLPDACDQHGGPHLFMCLHHPADPTGLAWCLGAAVLGRALWATSALARGLWLTRRLAARLGNVASESDRYMVVPGRASFTAGWPRSQIFIGDELLGTLSRTDRSVVVTHEEAHRAGHHVALKLAAKALAALHVPRTGRRLLTELGLAIEQACDVEAARAVGDPLVVADTVVALARHHIASPAGAFAGFTDAVDALSRRVTALCNPPWQRDGVDRAWWPWLPIAAAALTGFVWTLDRHVHDLTEAFLQLLGS
jgi:hypothetical protein